MAEYDKAIAMLDSQIAGVQKPSDRLDLLFYHRGYAKELKGDIDVAVADYGQAIAIKPSYEAGAYSRRGDMKKARGDLAGAIADYQHAVQYAQLSEDKQKLQEAKAEVNQRQSPNKAPQGGSKTFQAAKAEYEASSHDEAARVRYVTKLADIHAQMIEHYWNTGDKTELGSDLANNVDQELSKHPAPRNADARKLSQLLIGKWRSPRHVYTFRADGTYGVADEQQDKWRIEGNEYIDDVSRGPVVLIDRNYFIYAEGQGVAFYIRVRDSEADSNQSSAGTAAQTEMLQEQSPAEAKTGSNNKAESASDSAIKQKLLGYWKSPRHGYLIKSDGIIYMLPRKYASSTNRWKVKSGLFYWDDLPHEIITLDDKKCVYRSRDRKPMTFTLIRSTKP